MWYGDTVIDPNHHAQGLDTRASLQPVPQCGSSPNRFVVCAREVNPDADMAPSDSTQLVLDMDGRAGCAAQAAPAESTTSPTATGGSTCQSDEASSDPAPPAMDAFPSTLHPDKSTMHTSTLCSAAAAQPQIHSQERVASVPISLPPSPSQRTVSTQSFPVNSTGQCDSDNCHYASAETVGCYDTAGHLAGRVTLRRLHCLEQQWRDQQEATTTPAHRLASLPDALYAAMTARGVHRAPARTGQRALRRWQPCTSMWTAIQDAFATQHDWFSSPFSTCTSVPMYATAYPCDTMFGAVHNAYAFKWTGSGVFNPPNSPAAAVKALRWALQSTTESTPVFNIGFIPERKTQADINRLIASDRVHQLCRIAARSLQGSHAECWYNDRPEPFKNDHSIRVVLVFNDMGLTQLRPDALQALRLSLLSAGARVLDWDGRLPDADVPMTAPKLAKRFRMASFPPDRRSGNIR